MLRRPLLIVIGFGWCLPRMAGAEPVSEPYRVELTLGTSCPAARTFGWQLEARTKRLRAALAGERALLFSLQIATEDSGIVGRLTLTEPNGTTTLRILPGRDCAEVVSALALVGAIIVDANASTAPLRLPDGATAAPPAPESPIVRAHPRPGQSWVFGAELGAGLESGALPEVEWGPMVGVAVFPPMRTLPAAALLFSFREMKSESIVRTRGTARFAWTAGRFGFCPTRWPAHSLVAIRPCASLELGLLRATPDQTINRQHQERIWVAPGLLVTWELGLGRAVLGADFGANLIANRAKFYFGPDQPAKEEVYQVPLFGFSANMWLGLRFP